MAPTLPFDPGSFASAATAACEKATGLFGLERADHVARLVLVVGRAALRRQIVAAEGDEAFLGHAPRHVLDVRVEAAVLVDHEHGGIGSFRRLGAPDSLDARRDLRHLGPDRRVVLGNDLGVGIIVLEHGEQRRGRRGAAGKSGAGVSRKSRRFMPPWV